MQTNSNLLLQVADSVNAAAADAKIRVHDATTSESTVGAKIKEQIHDATTPAPPTIGEQIKEKIHGSTS